MERIKVALEKARQNRERNPSTTPEKLASSLEETRAPASPAEISYSRTRVVEVPPDRLRSNRIVAAHPQSPYADAFKILRTQILQRMKENGWKTLAVTSPNAGEGKTLTALNLAASMAMEISHTVLLVDTDLREPGVAGLLGIDGDRGLADYLLDDAPLEELLVHPEPLDHLVVLPAGRSVINSAELLNSPNMAQLVQDLRNRYPERIVVFDLPPVLQAADALAFAPNVDAILLVFEEGRTSQEDAQRTVELLEGHAIIGTVLNKAAAD